METRQKQRLPIELNTRLNIDQPSKQNFDTLEKNIEAKIIDISVLGIGIVSSYFIPKGVIISFELKIKDKTFNVRGEVKSAVSMDNDLTRLGVKFVDLSDENKNIISDFIKEYEKRVTPRLNLT